MFQALPGESWPKIQNGQRARDALQPQVNVDDSWHTLRELTQGLAKLGGEGVMDTALKEIMEPKAATPTDPENTKIALSLERIGTEEATHVAHSTVAVAKSE